MEQEKNACSYLSRVVPDMIFSSSSKNRSSRRFLMDSSTAVASEVCMSINLTQHYFFKTRIF